MKLVGWWAVIACWTVETFYATMSQSDKWQRVTPLKHSMRSCLNLTHDNNLSPHWNTVRSCLNLTTWQLQKNTSCCMVQYEDIQGKIMGPSLSRALSLWYIRILLVRLWVKLLTYVGTFDLDLESFQYSIITIANFRSIKICSKLPRCGLKVSARIIGLKSASARLLPYFKLLG